VIEDYELTRYVNLVGNTVARKSDRPNLNYHFAVLDTDIINAFACPGGYIFVTRGTLNIIDSESELAAVLAHEVAHVAKKHIVKEIEKTKFLSAGTRVAGDLLNAGSQTFEAVTSIGTDFLFKGLSRSDEYEADRYSLVYSSSAGYEPTSLVTFLEKLKSEGSGSNSGGLALLFSTHPKVDDRLSRASTAMSELGLRDLRGVSLSDRYDANVRPIIY
jgi:predicted Zn-dependent protease